MDNERCNQQLKWMSILHVVYLHIKDKWRKNPLYVTNFAYFVLLENLGHSAVSFGVFKKCLQTYLSVIYFMPSFFVVLDLFGSMKSLMTNIQTKVHAVTKINTSDRNQGDIYINPLQIYESIINILSKYILYCIPIIFISHIEFWVECLLVNTCLVKLCLSSICDSRF